MTDPSQPGPQQAPLTGADPDQQGGPQLRALSQFVKDLSFENPGNPMAQGQPNIDIGIDVQATPHRQGNGVYEVSLKLRAVAQIQDTTLFVLELDYGGLFQIDGMNEAEAEPALLIECPRLLFPFARRLIADITREGGFPPLLIDPVDFSALYRNQKLSQSGQSGGEAPAQQA